jgi:hypothetical protein
MQDIKQFLAFDGMHIGSLAFPLPGNRLICRDIGSQLYSQHFVLGGWHIDISYGIVRIVIYFEEKS